MRKFYGVLIFALFVIILYLGSTWFPFLSILAIYISALFALAIVFGFAEKAYLMFRNYFISFSISDVNIKKDGHLSFLLCKGKKIYQVKGQVEKPESISSKKTNLLEAQTQLTSTDGTQYRKHLSDFFTPLAIKDFVNHVNKNSKDRYYFERNSGRRKTIEINFELKEWDSTIAILKEIELIETTKITKSAYQRPLSDNR